MMRRSSGGAAVSALTIAGGVDVGDPMQRFDGRRSGECARARHGFVGNASEREHIRAVIGRPALDLLRRHVAHCPEKHSGCAGRRQGDGVRGAVACRHVGPQLRQPEVQHLRVPAGRDHDVFGLEVAVHDAGGVRRRERFRDLHQRLDRALHVDPPRVDERAQRVAGDQLHRQVVHRREARNRGAVAHRRRLANLVDGDDVRVVERRGRPRLLHEPGQPRGVADHVGRQDLQRNRSREHRVAGAVDVPHPALPNQRLDLVLPKRRTDEIGRLCPTQARSTHPPTPLIDCALVGARRARDEGVVNIPLHR